MSFRVYDKKKRRWVQENVYLSPDGELYESYKTILGQNKISAMSQDRYIYHKFIELYDKNNKMIYVGDFLEAQVAEDRVVTGLVTYADELSSYVILCDETSEYFLLGKSVSQDLRVVGNVFEEPKKKKPNN